jgi:hypothetical protein
LLGLDKRPQEIPLQYLMLMQQGTFPYLLFQNLLGKIPILTQLAGNVVEVSDRKGRDLVVDFFLQLVARLPPEL